MVLIFLAAWRRPEITEICFVGLNRIKNRFGYEALVVISEESMIPLCEKYNIRWTFYKNEPLGEKKNHGLNEAMKLEWDYLLEIGSDDLIKDELIELYQPLFGKYDYFGTKDAVIIDSATGRCNRLKSDTTYGLGRCISRKVIEEVCYGVEILAKDDIITRGRTTPKGKKNFFKIPMAKELEQLGRLEIISAPRYRLWKDDINRGLDNNSDYFLMTQGIGHRAIKTNEPLTIDIKGKDNIWPYDPKIGTAYDLNEALKGLSEEEKSMIFNLWKRNHNRVEYAHTV
jgi:hypothetical protein